MSATKVEEEIFKTIDYAINKKTKKFSQMDAPGVIDSVKPDGSYTVQIQGESYAVPNGCGISFKAGDLVWVHSPNGDFNRKYIVSARVSNSKTFSNAGEGEYGGGGGISPEDIITDAEIDAMFE